jgi:hypothetical protein
MAGQGRREFSPGVLDARPLSPAGARPARHGILQAKTQPRRRNATRPKAQAQQGSRVGFANPVSETILLDNQGVALPPAASTTAKERRANWWSSFRKDKDKGKKEKIAASGSAASSPALPPPPPPATGADRQLPWMRGSQTQQQPAKTGQKGKNKGKGKGKKGKGKQQK